MEPLLIALAGQKGSGKDTCASFLVSELQKCGISASNYKLAASMKRGVRAMFGWTEDHTDGHLKEVHDAFIGNTPRNIMETYGSLWRDGLLSLDVWVQVLAREIDADGLDVAVISDCRFPHEADWVRSQGGVVVHILRSPRREIPWYLRWLPYERAIGWVYRDVHPAEWPLEVHEGDIVISNTGSVEDLEMQLDEQVLDLVLCRAGFM